MTEAVSKAIVKSYLLYQDTASCYHVIFIFQLLTTVKKSSILDVWGDPDRPLITVFGKVIIHLVQANVIQFNLIAIYGGIWR